MHFFDLLVVSTGKSRKANNYAEKIFHVFIFCKLLFIRLLQEVSVFIIHAYFV